MYVLYDVYMYVHNSHALAIGTPFIIPSIAGVYVCIYVAVPLSATLLSYCSKSHSKS